MSKQKTNKADPRVERITGVLTRIDIRSKCFDKITKELDTVFAVQVGDDNAAEEIERDHETVRSVKCLIAVLRVADNKTKEKIYRLSNDLPGQQTIPGIDDDNPPETEDDGDEKKEDK